MAVKSVTGFWVGGWAVTYSGGVFTEQAWQAQKGLPGTALPQPAPRPFPIKAVLLCHHQDKGVTQDTWISIKCGYLSYKPSTGGHFVLRSAKRESDLFYLPSSPVFLPQWRQNVSPQLALRWGRCTLGLWPGWTDGCDLLRQRRTNSQTGKNLQRKSIKVKLGNKFFLRCENGAVAC